MKTHNLVQGSPEWLAFRRKHNTASEAPAMMGASPYQTRNDLLRQKATGDEQVFDDATLARFEEGHRVEAAARPIAERLVGEELFPATVSEDEGNLSASYDGTTMLEDTLWECKQWNEKKAALVSAGELPAEDKWQVVQHFAVNPMATRLLYMVTDGTEEKCVYLWVTRNESDIKALRDGWALFDQDLANYVPVAEAPKAIGHAPETLPALNIQVQGSVVKSNLANFKATALAVFDGINTNLQTDEDFATADTTAKWCKEVESRLEATKGAVLAQTVSIDEVMRTLDDLKAKSREVRLKLENAVKDRKAAIRDEILQEAKTKFAEHMKGLNDSLPDRVLTASNTEQPDFAGVMSGKKTVKSLRAAVDQELARVKLAGNDTADRVRTNFKQLAELSTGHESLFADRAQLVFKAPDDLAAVVKTRIAEDQARIDREAEARAEADRERIRKEEAEKLRREEDARRQKEDNEKTDALKKQHDSASAPLPADAKPTPGAPATTATADQTAPAAAPPPAPAPQTKATSLDEELLAWRRAHAINNKAFDSLRALLVKHGALAAKAA